MKKLVLAFGVVGLFFAGSTFAATEFQVQNVSQDNVNAVRIGATSGDVLRYEISITGDSEVGRATEIDLTEVLDAATMVNAGGGAVDGNILVFPENFCLTCESQTFSFFVRANEECVNGNTLDVSFGGQDLGVQLKCDELAESGPETLILAVVALVVLLASVMFSNRKTC